MVASGSATPAQASLRLLLAMGSLRLHTTGDMVAMFGDVTRAFPHAPVDVPTVTRLPAECDGLVLHHGKEVVILRGGQWILIGKALYGYRRSPCLWQQWLAERLAEVSLQRSAIDPALF